MNCPACDASLDGLRSWSCPRCGVPLRERPRVRMEFEGEALEVLGWTLLTIPSVLLVIPFPWFLAAAGRWFCRNLVFGDGTRAEFRGKGGDVLVWCLLPGIGIVLAWTRSIPTDPGSAAAFGVLLWVAVAHAQIQIWRWFVANTAVGTGERFRFHGTVVALLGWQILNGLAALTVVGWAWSTAAMYRWAAENTRSANRAFAFHGEGFEVLWRSVAAALFALPIVTIPWVKLWYYRWVIANVTLGSYCAEDED